MVLANQTLLCKSLLRLIAPVKLVLLSSPRKAMPSQVPESVCSANMSAQRCWNLTLAHQSPFSSWGRGREGGRPHTGTWNKAAMGRLGRGRAALPGTLSWSNGSQTFPKSARGAGRSPGEGGPRRPLLPGSPGQLSPSRSAARGGWVPGGRGVVAAGPGRAGAGCRGRGGRGGAGPHRGPRAAGTASRPSAGSAAPSRGRRRSGPPGRCARTSPPRPGSPPWLVAPPSASSGSAVRGGSRRGGRGGSRPGGGGRGGAQPAAAGRTGGSQLRPLAAASPPPVAAAARASARLRLRPRRSARGSLRPGPHPHWPRRAPDLPALAGRRGCCPGVEGLPRAGPGVRAGAGRQGRGRGGAWLEPKPAACCTASSELRTTSLTQTQQIVSLGYQ